MKIVLNERYFKVLQQEPILYGKDFSSSNHMRQCDYSEFLGDIPSIYKALQEFCEHFSVPLVVLNEDSQRRVEI